MAQVAKKKTWKEMRDEEITKKLMWLGKRDEISNRADRFFTAGVILLFVAGFLIVAGDGVPAEPRLVKFALIALGVLCFVVLVPICFIVFFKLDKKLNRI